MDILLINEEAEQLSRLPAGTDTASLELEILGDGSVSVACVTVTTVDEIQHYKV